jgi:hypothetical protein
VETRATKRAKELLERVSKHCIRKVLESVEGFSWAMKASINDVMSMCWQLLPMVPSGMWCWKSTRCNQPKNLLSILTQIVEG